MNDVGLLSNILYRNSTKPIFETVRSVNLGALYETVVASQLKALDHKLFYYDNRSNGEVDFLIDDYERLAVFMPSHSLQVYVFSPSSKWVASLVTTPSS